MSFPSEDYKKQIRNRIEWVKQERAEGREPAPNYEIKEPGATNYLKWIKERHDLGLRVPLTALIALHRKGWL